MNPSKIKRLVGKYEVGRTIGEGTFAKVKFARNSETGEPVALKILDKEKVLKHKMAEQIKREVATMKLIKHPNVVRLYEVSLSLSLSLSVCVCVRVCGGGFYFDCYLCTNYTA
ncbi:hypothetical protein CsSME_00042238 [Camellia sinensis var. sinensis]